MMHWRVQYAIAYKSYRDCLTQLVRTTDKYGRLSQTLLDKEAEAHGQLMEARAHFLAALRDEANDQSPNSSAFAGARSFTGQSATNKNAGTEAGAGTVK